MDKKILEIQKKLNHPDYVPYMAYRRDAKIHSLICYVNNITGCYVSENYKPISIFIERSRLYMDENKSEQNELKIYYRLVECYFLALEELLN